MRRVGHGIAVIVALAALAWTTHWAWQLIATEFAALKVDRRVADAQTTVTYVLDPDQWTDFAVTGQGDALRILSTANLPTGARNDDNAPFTYALHYQLVSRNGDLIEDRVYHHRTRVAQLLDAQGRAVMPSFYQDDDLVPSRSQRLMINLEGVERPDRLRLRVAEAAPPIRDVVVRVYERAGTSLGTSARHFERLTRRQQQLLGSASVYGTELLNDVEKVRLMRSTWEPSGPSGVLGQDYHERRLYVVSEHSGTAPADEVVPPGLYMDANRRVRIPIPQSEDRVRLRIQPIAAAPEPDYDSLTIHWTGSRNTGRRSFAVPISAGEIVWEERMGAGWLEAAATFAATVTAYRVGAAGEQDITPEQRHQRMYAVARDLPITYRVDHLRDQTTPLRIDLRVEDPQFVPSATARYQLLGADDQIVDEGALTFVPQPSEYDRGTGPLPYPSVSDSERFYFRLPAAVAKIKILAEQPILVGAATRPLTFRHALRVPDAYDAFLRHHDDSAAPPTWFSIRPVDGDALIRAKRSRLLAVQSKPREDIAMLAADDFDWTDFFPDGAWLARHVLNPRDPAHAVRDQAHAVVFNRLADDRPVALRIVAEAHRQFVEPTLIYLRETDAPFDVTVRVDGRPTLSTQAFGKRGEIRLPPVSTDTHTVELDGPRGIDWFINHTDLSRDPVTRRLAYRLSDKGLRFYYTKDSADAETLSARVQLPHGTSYPARVRITLDLPHDADRRGPLPDLTLTERVFNIAARAGSVSVPVLGSDQFADLGHTLFVAFGAELPPGAYPVTVSLETPGEAYVSLYRRRAGYRPEHRLFFDTAGGPL